MELAASPMRVACYSKGDALLVAACQEAAPLSAGVSWAAGLLCTAGGWSLRSCSLQEPDPNAREAGTTGACLEKNLLQGTSSSLY